MNNGSPHAAASPPTADGAYARWLAAPKYRLNNLSGDAPAWPFIEVAELELLAFDQCIVFGATFPGDAAELAAAARRDAVVRQARDIARAAYAAYAGRAGVERRLRFARELVTAIEAGLGSSGALLPIAMGDPDRTVAGEADALRRAIAEGAPA